MVVSKKIDRIQGLFEIYSMCKARHSIILLMNDDGLRKPIGRQCQMTFISGD